jgi:hypothetical protein
MAWLFDYLKIVKNRNLCLNYFCGTCGASEYSAGLVIQAYKSLKKTIPNKVEFNNEIPTRPNFRDLKLNSKKECFEEISYQLSILQKTQITKIKNENKNLCPIKFIFLMALNENFQNILLDKITYTPIHEFYDEYQKERLRTQKRIEDEHKALAYAEEQAKLKKVEKKILKTKLHLKKIEDQKIRSKKFNDFISQLSKSDIKERLNLIINKSPFGIAAIPKEFFEISNSDQFVKAFKLLDQNTKDKFKKFLIGRKENHFKKIIKFIVSS